MKGQSANFGQNGRREGTSQVSFPVVNIGRSNRTGYSKSKVIGKQKCYIANSRTAGLDESRTDLCSSVGEHRIQEWDDW